MMLILLSLTACRTQKDNPKVEIEEPLPIADIFVDRLGDPIPALNSTLEEAYQNGSTMLSHTFTQKTGLGPTFNADSCAGCHQMPVPGGSAPRYRDFWLIQEVRWDGAMVNAGTNGLSPVRNQYATSPTYHIPPSTDATTYARRNTPPMFGVGLFAFITDADILKHTDPEDMDGDGISGRANFEKGEVGRFGYKSQAASLESFNRGAIFNQMGITSDPLFYEFLELQDSGRQNKIQSKVINQSTEPLFFDGWISWINSAHAQVAALDEPTVDDDAALDPEITNVDQRDLLVFSTYIGVPTPTPESERTLSSKQGSETFLDIGCATCHIPSLPSVIGALPAYTDLLLHDMGSELADGITVGFAQESEFRTQPLWGVGLHPPYLHDGRADTLREAIEWHGGEAQHSVDGWLTLSEEEQIGILDFLHDLGGTPNAQNFLNASDFTMPAVGEYGGPAQSLSTADQALFEKGLQLFDGNFTENNGLSPHFNADSCRACHQDPVIGGAGGLDVNVLRVDWLDEQGQYLSDDATVLTRATLPNTLPIEIFDWELTESNENSDTNEIGSNYLVIEARQPPSLLGLGEIENISQTSILENEDSNDTNGDGISGRAHWLASGQLGRFGWKAQISSIEDFVADALLQEIGITIHPSISEFTVEEDFDTCEDPEFIEEDVEALQFFVYQLAPPPSDIETTNPSFTNAECSSCHVPSLDGVRLYSDLLLHDMGYDQTSVVNHDDYALPSEFRTPPLWGIQTTAPYMHNGAAETLHDAIMYHGGEAQHSINLYQNMSSTEQEELIDFLEKL